MIAPFNPSPAAPTGPSSAPTSGGAPSYASGSASSSYGGAGGSPSGSSGGSGSGVQCQQQQISPGNYKFVCQGAAPSLKSTHILWLPGQNGQSQVVDIEVPNYKIQELIQAGYKQSSGSQNTQINVKLKKPDQSYDAQIDQQKQVPFQPNVNLQYEDVKDTVVHYPNDKPYSPLQGPLSPPDSSSSSSSASAGGPAPPSSGPGPAAPAPSGGAYAGASSSQYNVYARPQRQVQHALPNFAKVVYQYRKH